jgi:hypothetical protein
MRSIAPRWGEGQPEASPFFPRGGSTRSGDFSLGLRDGGYGHGSYALEQRLNHQTQQDSRLAMNMYSQVDSLHRSLQKRLDWTAYETISQTACQSLDLRTLPRQLSGFAAWTSHVTGSYEPKNQGEAELTRKLGITV